MIALPERLFTEEEYLLIERQAESRSEYFAGRISAMVGGSRADNIITINIAAEFYLQTKDA